jgi:hypothetical protein
MLKCKLAAFLTTLAACGSVGAGVANASLNSGMPGHASVLPHHCGTNSNPCPK